MYRHRSQNNETTVYHPLPPQWDLGGRTTSGMACQQKSFYLVKRPFDAA